MALNLFKSVGNDDELKRIPREIAILPLRNVVAYPYMVLPLAVAAPRFMKLIEDAVAGSHLVGLITGKAPNVEDPTPSQIYDVGTVARIHRAVKTPNNHFHVIRRGLPTRSLKASPGPI